MSVEAVQIRPGMRVATAEEIEEVMRMNRSMIVLLIIALTVTSFVPAICKEIQSGQTPDIQPVFVPNEGQWADSIRYRAFMGDRTFWFTEDRIYVVGINAASQRGISPSLIDTHKSSIDSSVLLSMTERDMEANLKKQPAMVSLYLQGAQPTHIQHCAKSVQRFNFFIGRDPSRWSTNVPGYDSLVLTEVYPGVDLVYTASTGNIIGEFVDKGGLSASDPVLAVSGVDSIGTSMSGNVRAHSRGVTLSLPSFYSAAASGTNLLIDNVIANGFPRYRPVPKALTVAGSSPLWPELLYLSYIGGSSTDALLDVGIDTVGNVILVGKTESSDFPTLNPINDSLSFTSDGFILRMSNDGSTVISSTYFGGNSQESCQRVDVAADGTINVVGETHSTDLPAVRSFDSTWNGDYDLFVVRLSSGCDSLLLSTYLGGSQTDYPYGIDTDHDGNVIVGGTTTSADFPTAASLDNLLEGQDLFVTKIAVGDGGLVFSTYLGGGGLENTGAVAVDGMGNIYVTGSAWGSYPIVNALDSTHNGTQDIVVTKISPLGDSIIYSTFIGGTEQEIGRDIAVSEKGEVFAGGLTLSNDLPVVNALYDHLTGSEPDIFLLKLDSSGRKLEYLTYFGGYYIEDVQGVTVDRLGRLYACGDTHGPIPLMNPIQPDIGGNRDGYIVTLSPTGSCLLFSTYLGGTQFDNVRGIEVARDGFIYGVGGASSPDLPASGYDTSLTGPSDGIAFRISGFSQQSPSVTLSIPNNSVGMPVFDLTPEFLWRQATNLTLGYPPSYTLEIAIDSSFRFKEVIQDISDTTYGYPDSLTFGTHYWWRVSASSQCDQLVVGDSVLDFWTWKLGDLNHSHNVDLTDLSLLIGYLTLTPRPAINPKMVGDLTGDCRIDLSDLSKMVGYLTLGGVSFKVGCE